MPESSKNIETQKTEKLKQTTPQSVKFVDAPGYSSFYVNNVGLSVNQLDVVLPELEATVERRARVTMNPAQAKAMSKVLNYAVTAYELQSGRPVDDLPINLPELPAR